MITDSNLWIVIALCAVGVLSFILGLRNRISSKGATGGPVSPLSKKHPLTKLFDSYSDKALDNFVESLKPSSENLDIYLSVAKFFRSKGQVDKAIFLHQNLLADPVLARSHSDLFSLELAKDYRSAGLFDRAESLLEELIDSATVGEKSKEVLLGLYERELDWEKALALSLRMDTRKHGGLSIRRAQYCSELAEQLSPSRRSVEGDALYRQALNYDKTCARAYLGRAEIALGLEEYGAAISHIRELANVQPQKLELALPLLETASKETASLDQYLAFLQRCYEADPSPGVLLAIYKTIRMQEGDQKADDFLLANALNAPSLSILEVLLSQVEDGKEVSQELLRLVRQLIDVLHLSSSKYSCQSCGFEASIHSWLCPRCRQWSTSVINYS